jgi:hypothetical protein
MIERWTTLNKEKVTILKKEVDRILNSPLLKLVTGGEKGRNEIRAKRLIDLFIRFVQREQRQSYQQGKDFMLKEEE